MGFSKFHYLAGELDYTWSITIFREKTPPKTEVTHLEIILLFCQHTCLKIYEQIEGKLSVPGSSVVLATHAFSYVWILEKYIKTFLQKEANLCGFLDEYNWHFYLYGLDNINQEKIVCYWAWQVWSEPTGQSVFEFIGIIVMTVSMWTNSQCDSIQPSRSYFCEYSCACVSQCCIKQRSSTICFKSIIAPSSSLAPVKCTLYTHTHTHTYTHTQKYTNSQLTLQIIIGVRQSRTGQSYLASQPTGLLTWTEFGAVIISSICVCMFVSVHAFDFYFF